MYCSLYWLILKHLDPVFEKIYILVKILTISALDMVVAPTMGGAIIALYSAEHLSPPVKVSLDYVLAYWAIGMLVWLQLGIQVGAMRKVLREGVLWFLKTRDLRSMARNRFSVQLQSSFTTSVFFATIISILYRVPLRLCSRFFVPFLFPLQIEPGWVEIIVLQATYPLIFKLLRPRSGVENVYKLFFKLVGSRLLGLDNYLFGDDSQPRPKDFRLRIVCLVAVGWLTLVALLSLSFSGVLLCGSSFFRFVVSIRPPNDLYVIVSGVFILRAIYAMALMRRRFLQAAMTGIMIGLLWFVSIPILAGLCVELVALRPLLSSPDRSFFFSLWREWILGILFVKLCMFFSEIRVPFQRIFDDPARGGGGAPLIKISWMLMRFMIVFIALPHALLPHFRFAHILFACSLGVGYVFKKTISWVERWRDAVRDELYLVGRKLQNHHSHMGSVMRRAMSNAVAAASSSSSSAVGATDASSSSDHEAAD
jgi:hypothetical protein